METDKSEGELVFRLVHDDDNRWLVTPEDGTQRVVSVSALMDIFSDALARQESTALGSYTASDTKQTATGARRNLHQQRQ